MIKRKVKPEEKIEAVESYLSGEQQLQSFARSIIAKVEENPEMDIPYNAYVMFRCDSEIKNAVNAYYGYAEIATCATKLTVDTLQDNEVYARLVGTQVQL